MEKTDHNTKIVILGQMVLDTVFSFPQSTNQFSLPKSAQNVSTLGGPPIFAGITSIQLSKVLPWITPPLIYAYTCDSAKKQIRELNDKEILLQNLVTQHTCPHFRLIYRNHETERELYIKNPPRQFNPADFNWDFSNPPTAIVGSIYNEFDNPEIFSFLRKRCDFIAYDPQGHFRTANSNGYITYKSWKDLQILSNIDCLKLSEFEALFMGLGSDPIQIVHNLLKNMFKLILLTRGSKGCILGFGKSSSKEEKIYIIPAFTKGRVIDETGAGDVFLSAFITHFKAHNDVLAAAGFATSIASLLIEKPGYQGNFSKENINSRQKTIESQIREFSIH